MNRRSAWLALSLILIAPKLYAQGGPAEPSGIYQVLNLGVDAASGQVTGFYQDGPGDEDSDITPHFTCVFYLAGKKSGASYSVQAWKPKEGGAAIPGELSFEAPKKAGGKPSVRLKLSKMTDGCTLANPSLGKPEGAELHLSKPGSWTAVRMVKADKAYFFESPDAPAPKKSHASRGDVVVVTDTKPGWVFADTLIRDKGWLKEADLFATQP